MYELLNTINSPEDVKKLSPEQRVRLCEEVRQYMVECCAVNPGHLGSSLGAVELIVALHTVFNTPKDKIVYDVGHQAYAHKILTGGNFSGKTAPGTASAASPNGTKAPTTPLAPDIRPRPFRPRWALQRPHASPAAGIRPSPSLATAPSPAAWPGKA